MVHAVGETVVYPNHGAAVIEAIETRQIKGEDVTYLVLRIIGHNDLVVRAPARNLDVIGVREPIGPEQVEQVFDTLRGAVEEDRNWSRRFKANMEKIHSGDVMQAAQVVRDLSRRDRDRGVSAGEKRMLTKARDVLASELALARDVDEDRASQMIDEVLASS